MRPPWIALALLVLAYGCKQRETQLKLQFPGSGDGGTGDQQTSIKCVNYLQFTVGTGEFSSCTKVEVVFDDLCDLAKVAEGQELFNLPPDTPLPITIEGLRIFPAIGCGSIQACTPRKIFSGTTVGGDGRPGRIGDYAGGVLELPVKMNEACGLPGSSSRFPRAAPARRFAACRRSSATTSRAAACARDRRAPAIWSRDKGLLTPVNSRPGGGTRRTVGLAPSPRRFLVARRLLFARPVA